MKRLIATLPTALGMCLFLVLAPVAKGAEKSKTKIMGEAPAADKVLVYFIRKKKIFGAGRTVFVYADGTFLGTVDNNCFTYSYIEPGEHLLWLNIMKVSETVNLEPGETYYYDVWPAGNDPDIENIGSGWGNELIDGVKSHCAPTRKEILKSTDHITKLRGEVEAAEAKKFDGKSTWRNSQKTWARRGAMWPRVDLSGYPVLLIDEFTLSDPKEPKRRHAQRTRTASSRVADLVEQKVINNQFIESHRGAPQDSRDGAVILRVEITKYRPVNKSARAVTGYLLDFTAATKFDFSVRLIDSSSGDELVEFADSWYATSQYNGIQELEGYFAIELTRYLKDCKLGNSPKEEM